MIVLHCADALKWVKKYTGPKFHAMFSDPPYHLTSIAKRFGKPGAAPAQQGTDGAFARASKGFMGQTWDGGDIAFRPETWATFGELLYPGAFGMALASSRGWHRLAVAIEDAGFVIHPSIFGWVYGSGFPKATRIKDERFDGHRYGQQALKPALEPIIVFQKPYEGRPQDNMTATGAGALNVDAGRIGNDERTYKSRLGKSLVDKHYELGDRPYTAGLPSRDEPEATVEGRWPSNFALVHDPACTPQACTSNCPVAKLGQQSGVKGPSGSLSGKEPSQRNQVYGKMNHRGAWQAYDDDGTAARYFLNADWALEVAEQLAQADPVRYEPKAGSTERNLGLDDFEPATVGDGRQKPIDNAYQRGKTERRNVHPTVKPIALTTWLAKLLLPPEAYAPRRIFVPFAGSGSEMIGAQQAGWDEIVGVELSEEYARIAQARLAYFADPLSALRGASSTPDKPVQLSMFEEGESDGE